MLKAFACRKLFSENKKSLFTSILVFLFSVYQSTAQPLFFTNFGIEHGMPSSLTSAVIQDKNGFIWIGTQEGLCRYDGYRTTVFKNQNNPNSICSNNISALLLDGNFIWIGTWNGLCIINTESFNIQRINIGGSKAIRALLKDKSGNIWIGTSNGLIIYNVKQNSYQFFDQANSRLSHNTIRCIYQARNGDMWIGTYDGINRFRNNKFKPFDLKGTYKPWLKNNLVLYIAPYSAENDTLLWVGTETGLCLFNTVTFQNTTRNLSNTRFSNEVVKCIYKQNDSILWLGTDFGLDIYNTRSKNVEVYYHDPLVNTTISNNVIWQIYKDNVERLWFITSNGVSLLDNHEKTFRFHEEYNSLGFPRIGNLIRDILVSRNGKIWLASLYGVICHDPLTDKTENFTENGPSERKILLNNVFALAEDYSGRIWIGTAGGINIWDQNRNKMYSVTSSRNNGLTSNYISGFAFNDSSSFWVSVWEGGLFKVISDQDKPETMRFMRVDNDGEGKVALSDDQILYSIHKELWFIDPKTYEKRTDDIIQKTLKDKEISCILGEKDGTVWIGAENLLLKYSVRTKKLEKLDLKIGTQNILISLLKDKYGNIWASTHYSILKIDFDQKRYYTIPISPNFPLKSFYSGCAEASADGSIYFGGDNGYISIDPKTIMLPKKSPSIYLTNLAVNNQIISPLDSLKIIYKDVPFCKDLNLNYKQNSLTFEFSTLDYLFPDVSQYAYRLKYHDNTWHYTTDGKNFAIYSNLSPGDYEFEVKGTDHFGIWSSPVSLAIRIDPPVWLSKIFILIYFIFFSGLAYLVFRILRYRHHLRQELRMARLEKQHAEELFRTKQQFFTNISHEFRTPLSLILPPIQQVLKSEITDPTNKKLLKLAKRNALRLYKLVNQLLDFGKIESSRLSLTVSSVELVSLCKFVYSSFKDMARRNEINYQFNSEIKTMHTEIDVEKFETILFNLLSNAFKYTLFGGSIELKILPVFQSGNQDFLTIKVIDTGIGISKEEQEKIFERFYQTSESKALNLGSGIGLTLSQEYARLHKGSITVESSPSKGSSFNLSIPIKQMVNLDQNFANEIPGYTEGIAIQQNHELKQNLKNILIIDDNEDILDYIEMNLVNQYNVFRASNGMEGLEMILKIMPHLVISDIMMPVMDGIDLCTKIRENLAIAHIPVILLSAKTLPEQKAEGMNTGADLYISKPFDIEYFKSCVNSIFRREEQVLAYIKNELLLNPGQISAPEKNQDEKFLKKVIELIEKNYGNQNFSVETLSDAIGLSSTHLHRKLKQLTNQSTIDIIKNYRMQKAALMIKNNEGNITEIMYSVGFSSLSSFSKSFKSVFSVSPSNYVEELKN